jgi:hypothetical protein
MIEAASSAVSVDRIGSEDTEVRSVQQSLNVNDATGIFSQGTAFFGTQILFMMNDPNYGVMIDIPLWLKKDGTVDFAGATSTWAFNGWLNLGDYLRLYAGKFFGGIRSVPRYNGASAYYQYTLSGYGVFNLHESTIVNNNASVPFNMQYLSPMLANSWGPVNAVYALATETDQLDGPVVVEYRNRKETSPFIFQFAWMGDAQITRPGSTEDAANKLGARLYTSKLTPKFDFSATWTWARSPVYAFSGATYVNTIGAWGTFTGLVDGLNFTLGYSAIVPVYATGTSGRTQYLNGIDLFGSIKLSDTLTLYTQNNVSIGWNTTENTTLLVTDTNSTTDFTLFNLITTAIPLDANKKFELRPVVRNTLMVRTTGQVGTITPNTGLVEDNVKFADRVLTTDQLVLAADFRYRISPQAYVWAGFSLAETFSQYTPNKGDLATSTDEADYKKNDDVIKYDNIMKFSIPIGISVAF